MIAAADSAVKGPVCGSAREPGKPGSRVASDAGSPDTLTDSVRCVRNTASPEHPAGFPTRVLPMLEPFAHSRVARRVAALCLTAALTAGARTSTAQSYPAA